MELLGIQDVTTNRQRKNGTVQWRLPIKNNWPRQNPSYIEVASFKAGYIRRQNGCYTPYQLNKREITTEKWPKHKTYWSDDGDYIQKETGEYYTREVKTCKLIPKEIDRLEYMMKYCIKNYFIKQANQVSDGKFVPEWMYESRIAEAELESNSALQQLSVTVNNERYSII